MRAASCDSVEIHGRGPAHLPKVWSQGQRGAENRTIVRLVVSMKFKWVVATFIVTTVILKLLWKLGRDVKLTEGRHESGRK